MALESDKKIILLYVYNILKDFTDSKHLLTYSEIISKLEIIYGIRPNIKSIARNIDTLIEYGYDIEKKNKSGCYLAKRDFDDSEVMFLVDAVYSSKSISPNNARELIKKLTKNCSNYERKKYKHIYKVEEISRKRSTQLFQNIELLNEAIEQRKKVSFQYNEYDTSKNFLPRFEGKQFIMNPYFLVNNNGKYYLVCNYNKYDNLANYKIECMSSLKIMEDDVKPLKSLPGQENFKQDEYINEHIYMMTGESVKATIKLDSTKVINDIIDWFGDKVEIIERDNSLYAELKVNEQALIYWALQYGDAIEIVSPERTRKNLRQKLKEIMEKYGI